MCEVGMVVGKCATSIGLALSYNCCVGRRSDMLSMHRQCIHIVCAVYPNVKLEDMSSHCLVAISKD